MVTRLSGIREFDVPVRSPDYEYTVSIRTLDPTRQDRMPKTLFFPSRSWENTCMNSVQFLTLVGQDTSIRHY